AGYPVANKLPYQLQDVPLPDNGRAVSGSGDGDFPDHLWFNKPCSLQSALRDFVGCGGQRHDGATYAGLDQVLGDGIGPVRLNGDLQAGIVICGQALNQATHAVRCAGQNQLLFQHLGNRNAGPQGGVVGRCNQIQGFVHQNIDIDQGGLAGHIKQRDIDFSFNQPIDDLVPHGFNHAQACSGKTNLQGPGNIGKAVLG